MLGLLRLGVVLSLLSCGGRVVVDVAGDAAGATGTGGATGASVSASTSAGTGGAPVVFPCETPQGRGLSQEYACLADPPQDGCPAFYAPGVEQALFEQALAACQMELSSCCPTQLSVFCGPDPAPEDPGACCYIVLTVTPVEGCL